MAYGGGFDMGASQFAGGGFVPSPAAGGGDIGYSGGQKSNKPVTQTMRDVTIRQLIRDNMNSNDDTFKVDNVELATFFIVGRIVSRMDSNAALKLKIDDGTGVIEVLHYMEDNNELINQVSQEWQVNTYVRVCGSLRMVEQKKSMMAFRIKVVKDFNEVTYHNLQAIFQHLHLTKGMAPAGAAPQGFTPRPSAAPPSTLNYSAAAPAAAGPGSGNRLHMDVLAVYNEAVNVDNGLSLDDVHRTLMSQGVSYTKDQVLQAVEFMTNEGQLYSTIDDQHHRSTSM